ncbi:SDR family NAD(P)-dependent oxidoreductase, partial [Pseudonocardia pini]|uniref:SDR family NAD(P)-dependent oxidoreductase n=1 Tax=Pseudonocardia pini TaxID=2758030 RepID=UPI0015F001B2
DVTSEEDLAALAGTVRTVLGRLDVLHLNVGLMIGGPTAELAPERWRAALDVNLTGLWLTCRELLPVLREQGGGAVVAVSSLASFGAGHANIAYTTSKAALNSMCRSLALEYAPHGVRINVVAPGMVDTPMAVDAVVRRTGTPRAEVVAAREALIPMGHQGTAWDIANAALFLASDEAAFVTGVVLPVDGGSSLGIPSPTHR